jgi:hypothetical protein
MAGWMRTAATYLYHTGIFGILAVFAAEFAVGGRRTITRTMRAFFFFRVGHNTTFLWCSTHHDCSLSVTHV